MDVHGCTVFIGLNKLHRLQAHPTQSPILTNLGLWQLAEHHAESIHGAMSHRLPVPKKPFHLGSAPSIDSAQQGQKCQDFSRCLFGDRTVSDSENHQAAFRT